jgi:serine/threonine protein kinase
VTTSGSLFAQRYRVGAERPDVAFVDSISAVDEKLNRQVVLTRIKERFASNQPFVDKFVRHGRSGLGIAHPALARTYDVGVDDATGETYLVSELPGGETLHEILKRGALGNERAAKILRQVAQGLSFAAGRGLHHLGLTPKNIWVTADDRALVTGLAVAALAAETAPTADFLASALGTSGYLAPEQILRQPVGEATDVYALGLILSQALCGRPTWDRNLRGVALTERAEQRAVLPGTVIPTVPNDLDALISEATEVRPADRSLTLSMIADRLEAYVAPTHEIDEVPAAFLPPTEPFVVVPPAGVAAPAAPTVAPGINPSLAKVFPARSLSKREFSTAEFNAGRTPQAFRSLLTIAVGSVVGLAALILIVVSALPANVIPSTSRPIPNVVGYSYDQAATAITDAGLKPVRQDKTDETVPPGTVISVSPAVGTKVEIGSTVGVTVSLGAKTAVVPNVVGTALASAQKILQDAGFVLGVVTEVPNGSVVKGAVAATDPVGGQTRPAGSTINLSVANGKVTIPNLVGKTVTEATTILGGPTIGMTPKLAADTGCAASSPVTVSAQSAGPGDVERAPGITLTYCTGH